MEVKLITITPNAERLIAYFARVSNKKNQENPKIENLIKYCLDNGHVSIFEHSHATFEIITSIGISRQILRHRSFCFQEFSTRYAKIEEGIEPQEARRQDEKNRQNSLDDLNQIQKDWFNYQQQLLFDNANEIYNQALKKGIAKECARALLPINTKTRLYMTGNIRSWIHYIDLRSGNGTQKEHQEIALAIKEKLIEELPIISKALHWA